MFRIKVVSGWIDLLHRILVPVDTGNFRKGGSMLIDETLLKSDEIKSWLQHFCAYYIIVTHIL